MNTQIVLRYIQGLLGVDIRRTNAGLSTDVSEVFPTIGADDLPDFQFTIHHFRENRFIRYELNVFEYSPPTCPARRGADHIVPK